MEKIETGVAHKVPKDLRAVLISDKKSLEAWNKLTPLGRNEFICWIEDAKQIDTRKHRLKRTYTEIKDGKRRPCCWIGCIHRKDKSMSPSQKYILGKKSKKNS